MAFICFKVLIFLLDTNWGSSRRQSFSTFLLAPLFTAREFYHPVGGFATPRSSPPLFINTNEKIIVTVIASPTLHRPEPIRFGAPHGVQGEGRGNLIFGWDCFVAPLLAMTRYYAVCINYSHKKIDNFLIFMIWGRLANHWE
jgi:hypothetical protein